MTMMMVMMIAASRCSEGVEEGAIGLGGTLHGLLHPHGRSSAHGLRQNLELLDSEGQRWAAAAAATGMIGNAALRAAIHLPTRRCCLALAGTSATGLELAEIVEVSQAHG